MVCGNEEELGAPIGRVVSPRLDLDADMIFFGIHANICVRGVS